MNASLDKLARFSPTQRRKTMAIPRPADRLGAKSLLDRVRARGFGLAFYDEAYPSPSDPGAYFSYLPTDGERWQTTYGNHGWSAGIYEISEDTLVTQILRACGKIQCGDVAFFSHYPIQTDAKSRAKDAELRALGT